MDNILRDEVNQHTSDEVEKVLAELEAQGVDITALALNVTAIKNAIENSSSGLNLKKIQYGVITIAKDSTTGTATISSVDTSKSILLYLGAAADSNYETYNPYLQLTNSTKVTATRNISVSGVSKVGFCVVEFA